MAKKGNSIRWQDEVEAAIQKAIAKKQFKDKTDAVVTILKKFFKIKN